MRRTGRIDSMPMSRSAVHARKTRPRAASTAITVMPGATIASSAKAATRNAVEIQRGRSVPADNLGCSTRSASAAR
jgi:hypothetical protein